MNIPSDYEELALVDPKNFDIFTHIMIVDTNDSNEECIFDIPEDSKSFSRREFYFIDNDGDERGFEWGGGCFIPLLFNEIKTPLDKEVRDIRTMGYRYA